MDDNAQHRFHQLFEQLGLPSTPQEIAGFISRNRPLPNDVLLVEAPFWDDAQRQFLSEKKATDSPEWVQLIDQLNAALRDADVATHSNVGGGIGLLVISGSLRKASYNTALAYAAQRSAPQDVRVDVATLHGVPLYDGDVEASEGIPVAVRTLKARIMAADGIILATPEYNSGVPGVLKNAVDWLSRAGKEDIFANRPVALMGATMGGLGTALAQAAWLPTLRLLGAIIYSGGGMTLSRAQQAMNAQGELVDDAARKILAGFLGGYATFVRMHQQTAAAR